MGNKIKLVTVRDVLDLEKVGFGFAINSRESFDDKGNLLNVFIDYRLGLFEYVDIGDVRHASRPVRLQFGIAEDHDHGLWDEMHDDLLNETDLIYEHHMRAETLLASSETVRDLITPKFVKKRLSNTFSELTHIINHVRSNQSKKKLKKMLTTYISMDMEGLIDENAMAPVFDIKVSDLKEVTELLVTQLESKAKYYREAYPEFTKEIDELEKQRIARRKKRKEK